MTGISAQLIIFIVKFRNTTSQYLFLNVHYLFKQKLGESYRKVHREEI